MLIDRRLAANRIVVVLLLVYVIVTSGPLLPRRGSKPGLVSIAMLLLSIFLAARRIGAPVAYEISTPGNAPSLKKQP